MYVVAGFHKVVVDIRAFRGLPTDSSDDEDEASGWDTLLLLLASILI